MSKNIKRPSYYTVQTKVNGKKQVEVKSYDIEKLVKKHTEPEVWINHVKNDLMKFWDMEEAYTLENGLFPTYRDNTGKMISNDPEKYPEEIKAALASDETKGLVTLDTNHIKAHSRQTFAYGIAYNMTGDEHYLELCEKGAKALMNAFDKHGMFTQQNRQTGEWGVKQEERTSQDLAYGITGMGMYYYLTHSEEALYKILQAKEYIFKEYFSYGRGYFTWLPKKSTAQTLDDVEIVAQLDQIYAYMMWLTPALPEPYQSEWKNSLKDIVKILINKFYSERYGFFWGTGTKSVSENLGTDHTDFGHSVKTMWLIYEVGLMTGETSFVTFARDKIDKILSSAYVKETKSWARRFKEDGTLDMDKEWWGLAELDQACAIMALNDPSYLSYLNNTYKYWFEYMVDKEYGEIWHMVNGEDNKPDIKYPKIHCWKNALHSCEHALFGYLTSSKIKNKEFELYYAFESKDEVVYDRVSPYLFRANITNVYEGNKIDFMKNGNKKIKVGFYGLH